MIPAYCNSKLPIEQHSNPPPNGKVSGTLSQTIPYGCAAGYTGDAYAECVAGGTGPGSGKWTAYSTCTSALALR